MVKLFLRTDLAPHVATEVAALPFVLRHGSRDVPSLRAVSRTLEALFGAALGIDVLKLGEHHVLTFSLEVLGDRFLPAGAEVLRRGLELATGLLLDPARDERGHLRAEPVAQEKEKMRRLIEGLINDKGAYAIERCIQELCAGEPFSVFEYGALADLEGLDGAALEARRARLVAEAPIDVYLAGAFDPDQAEALIRALLPVERGELPPLRGTTPHPPAREVREVHEAVAGLNQGKLVLGYRTASRLGEPGYWPLLLMNGVLGGFAHSKLFTNVREKAGLCYDASSSLERFKGLLFVYAGIDPKDFARTRDLCQAQVEAIAQGEVSDDELGHTRLAFREAYRALLDSPQRLVNLDFMFGLGGLGFSPDDAVAALDAVTREQVQAAAAGLRLDTVYFLAPQGAPPEEPSE